MNTGLTDGGHHFSDVGIRKQENKNAVIHGAGGAVGGAVARGFAREGAKVFLASRTLPKLDLLAHEVTAAGGAAETARVDALDDRAATAHVDGVATRAGGIDILFNAVGWDDVQGRRWRR